MNGSGFDGGNESGLRENQYRLTLVAGFACGEMREGFGFD